MPFDLERARALTPGCNRVAHLNNAGAALMPTPVIDALTAHIHLEAREGGYEAAEMAHPLLEHFYHAAAVLLNCRRTEIAFMENATRAWDMAFYAFDFQPGDRILTSLAEYASNYIAYLQVSRRTGAKVEAVPNDESGALSVPALENMIDRRVKLISVTHVPTNGGLVNPAAAIGRVARAAGIPYLLDACQAVGQMPMDVQALGCDLLTATGRKFLRGPRGTGFLYVRESLLDQLEPPFLDLHAAEWTTPDTYTVREDARRFENWETNFAGKIALGAAIDHALDWGLDAIWERVRGLADGLREQLSGMPGVTVHDLGEERCAIVSLTKEGLHPEALRVALRARGINVSVSEASGTRLDMEGRGLRSLLRVSLHYYNSAAELDRFLGALGDISG